MTSETRDAPLPQELTALPASASRTAERSPASAATGSAINVRSTNKDIMPGRARRKPRHAPEK